MSRFLNFGSSFFTAVFVVLLTLGTMLNVALADENLSGIGPCDGCANEPDNTSCKPNISGSDCEHYNCPENPLTCNDCFCGFDVEADGCVCS